MIFSPLPGVPGTDYRIVQRFGEHPEVYKQFGLAGHNGLDIAPKVPGLKGIQVHAPHEGIVTLGDQGHEGYGKYVMIDGLEYKSGWKRKSYICHLDSFLVKNGDFVFATTVLGIMGMTGFATGIHTHFTYKLLLEGVVQNENNGYKGAIDISSGIAIWLPGHL